MDDKRKRQALKEVQRCLEEMGEIENLREELITQRNSRLAEVRSGRLFDDDFQSHRAWLCSYFPAFLVFLEKKYLQLAEELEAREASLDSGKDFKALICHTDPKVPEALDEEEKMSKKLYEEAYSEYQKVAKKKAEEANAEWEKEKKEAAAAPAPVLDEAAYEAQLLEASKTAFAAAKAKADFKAAVEAPATKEGEGTTSGGKEYAFHVKRPPRRRTPAAAGSDSEAAKAASAALLPPPKLDHTKMKKWLEERRKKRARAQEPEPEPEPEPEQKPEPSLFRRFRLQFISRPSVSPEAPGVFSVN